MDHASLAMGPLSQNWALCSLKHELRQFGPIDTGPLKSGEGLSALVLVLSGLEWTPSA